MTGDGGCINLWLVIANPRERVLSKQTKLVLMISSWVRSGRLPTENC